MKYIRSNTHDGACTHIIECYVCHKGICGWATDVDLNEYGREYATETTLFHGADYCADEGITLCSTHALLHRAVACDTFGRLVSARFSDGDQERERVAEGHI